MATKTCPSCGEDVPVAASRCKHCFHDFNEVQKKRNPLVATLAFVATLLVLGAGTFGYIFYFHAQEKIVVDAETQSIVFTRTTATKTSTERVAFSDVQKLEHVMGGDEATFEVVAVTGSGKRYVIKQSNEGPMQGYAEHVSAVMDKPLEEVRNIKTFGD